jgi:hypothetical protein
LTAEAGKSAATQIKDATSAKVQHSKKQKIRREIQAQLLKKDGHKGTLKIGDVFWHSHPAQYCPP